MRFVAIIGAGELGATIARTLAARDSIPEIRLVDDTGDVAAGKALDIGQSGPVEGFHTRVTASRDIRAAAGAVVIVIADRATSGEWTGEPALALLEQLARLSADSMFVCAGADQMTVVDRSVTELGIARQRILGSAPGALVSAMRAMIALEARASPADITLSLVGTPPDRFVVTWREASLGGTPLANVLDASALDRPSRLSPGALHADSRAMSSSTGSSAFDGRDRLFRCSSDLPASNAIALRSWTLANASSSRTRSLDRSSSQPAGTFTQAARI
jgi:malate/lactate dehydrogenase